MGKTACFTGHRPNKFTFGYDEGHEEYLYDKKSERLIAVFDGTPGGTKNAFDLAQKEGLEMIKINPKDLSITRLSSEKPATLF